MLEVARCVVAVAEADFRAGRVDLHANLAPTAVALHVGAEAVAEQVVAGVVLLNFGKRVAKVAEIEESFAAGVRGKRGERVARIFALVCLVKYRGPGEHRGAGGRVRGGVAARRRSHQAARIDRVDRNVGAIRSVRGGAKLGAI